jgi:hypothetical protein
LADDGTAQLDTASYQAMADCLGDALSAIISNRGDRYVAVRGVGTRTPASATSTRHEIVCLPPKAGAGKAVLSWAGTNALPDDTGSGTHASLSEYLSHTGVTAVGKFVRIDLAMKPDGPPGLVFTLLYSGTVQYRDGACTVACLRSRSC